MYLSKKITIIIIAILLIAIGAGIITAVVYYRQHSAEMTVQAGLDAERRGDTEAAYSEYQRAVSLCAPKDERCRIDMEMKVSLMKDTMENERNAVPGAKVPGAKIDPSEVVPPSSDD